MGHILHPSATTTTAIRRALQNSQESIRTLAPLQPQSQDRCQMEKAGDGRGHTDGT
jgi:hypothetical protein